MYPILPGNLVDAAVSAAENAIETVKGWLGIHSPSKRARDEIGVNMIAGVSEGVEEETPNLEKSVCQKRWENRRRHEENGCG